MPPKWIIKYYQAVDGNSPIYEFIEALPEKAIGKLVHTLALLTEFGVQLREPHVKKVSGTPIWELRILGEDSIRIFYVAAKPQTFLLLHAIKKTKQKTPPKEIKIAIKRLDEYRKRVNLALDHIAK